MAIALSPPTLGRLITNVRSMLNQPNAANSNWSDAQLTLWINQAVQRFFGEVVQNVEGHWTKIADINIVGGLETVDLPSDFFEVKALYKKVSNGYVVLPYMNAISDSYSTTSGASGEAYLPAYYFRENKIVLRNVPAASETAGLRIEYIYFPETMINAGDTMTTNVAPIFAELIEMYAVYKAKTQQSLVNGSNMAALAQANLGDLYKQFVTLIKNRSKYPTYIKPWSP